MKNINYVINGVLAVAVIILFVMQFSSKKESTVAPALHNGGRFYQSAPCGICKCRLSFIELQLFERFE